MKKYSTISDNSESATDGGNDSASVASSHHRRFKGHKRISSELSEPLTSASTSVVDESLGDDSSFSADPYFVFRSDLMKKLELVDESLTEYLRIVHETDTAVNTYEYKDAKKQLKRHLKNAESTLKDVSLTVQAIECDRVKFAHIDDSQLFERKSLVDTSRGRIQHAKDEMNSEIVKDKLLRDERNKAVRRAGDLGARNDQERQNTDFILDNQAQTSMLMQEQDETLDELGDAVTRVGEMAGAIHEEIGHQNKMLDDLDQDMTNAEEELGLVMGKLAKFLHTKDPWQLRTILCLSLTVVILFILVIYS
mmetsp:Transcript_21821/g.35125  ORF Transcript_21821/g.35125 Transcript_21821/m.35125 type:complete len:308 (+) Transcript_21821:95-1018(+)|eukprot:CAMPEP_0178733928 /NCGR_PEP_ID=MMETSP0744-20121128/1064_1 /TAXON_ID=913974 /ORGANISM="Nitzschia punctata, Strain CCMP561" /LENGTH=307 /DNA_ID=CAMNT_0020386159 /DNA_START=91 /DNA_END=1014 /DNA_ORIENTATION=-